MVVTTRRAALLSHEGAEAPDRIHECLFVGSRQLLGLGGLSRGSHHRQGARRLAPALQPREALRDHLDPPEPLARRSPPARLEAATPIRAPARASGDLTRGRGVLIGSAGIPWTPSQSLSRRVPDLRRGILGGSEDRRSARARTRVAWPIEAARKGIDHCPAVEAIDIRPMWSKAVASDLSRRRSEARVAVRPIWHNRVARVGIAPPIDTIGAHLFRIESSTSSLFAVESRPGPQPKSEPPLAASRASSNERSRPARNPIKVEAMSGD